MIKFYHDGKLISNNKCLDVEACFKVIESENHVIDGKMVTVITKAELMETSVNELLTFVFHKIQYFDKEKQIEPGETTCGLNWFDDDRVEGVHFWKDVTCEKCLIKKDH